jgi:hypothetical protein
MRYLRMHAARGSAGRQLGALVFLAFLAKGLVWLAAAAAGYYSLAS